jgi:putative ABC transport system permease protein
VVRQGVANLYRPNNRTVLLMLSLGLGTFLILTLFFIHETLLGQLSTTRLGNHPNVILFDIQPDQRESVAAFVRSLHLDVLEEAPIVTMRLLSIKGQPIEQMQSDARRSRPSWALQREYRSTWRDHLTDAETLVAGQWPAAKVSADAPVPISIEQGIAKDLGVKMGDEIVFDVQGVPMATRVASVRKVEWRRVQPNFFVVFPTGVLEKVPAFYVLATRVDSAQQSANLQREVVRQFPNVSVIDLTLIIQTVDSIVSRIASVVRFMAMFTVVTGLLVLLAAIATGRYQRLQESMLLRTLGASRRQILNILTTEYLCLGILAALTGIMLALAAGWALSTYVFKLAFVPALAPMLIALVVTATTTVLAGLLASRGICDHPPLEILRSDL